MVALGLAHCIAGASVSGSSSDYKHLLIDGLDRIIKLLDIYSCCSSQNDSIARHFYGLSRQNNSITRHLFMACLYKIIILLEISNLFMACLDRIIALLYNSRHLFTACLAKIVKLLDICSWLV